MVARSNTMAGRLQVSIIIFNVGGRNMKKSFKQMCDQLERIYTMFEHGFGTRKLLERAESFMFRTQRVGLMF